MQAVVAVIDRIASALRRGPIALGSVVLLGGIVLFLGLSGPGLWDPQERSLADTIAPPLPAAAPPKAEPAPAPGQCRKVAPPEAQARTLTKAAVVAGRDTIADSDLGRRLPLAILGFLTVLAAAGTALRTGGARAGAITGVVLLAMPLLALQSRMLTSEIGTAAGGALLIYGLVALSRPRRGLFLVPDLALSAVALAAGAYLAFRGGGVLLGLVPAVGAVAAAGGLGVPAVVAIVKRRPLAEHIPALLATLVAGALLALLAYQLYSIKPPMEAAGMMPAARQVAGHAVVPDACYSWALGGVWKYEDDLRYIFDSTFEQIAYGTYPWGILGVAAMASLVRDAHETRRRIGALCIAWAGGAWIACELFQRKTATPTIWGAFPALAIAIGVWVEGALERREALQAEDASDERAPGGAPRANGTALIIGVFVVAAALVFGKDMQTFTQKLTSIVAGGEVTYPVASKLLGLKTRLWVLLLGFATTMSFAIALAAWRPGASRLARRWRQVATLMAMTSFLLTIGLGIFWAHGWHRRLSVHLSVKTLFDTYHRLRKDGDQLVLMGDFGKAPQSYSREKPELLQNRAQVVAALKRTNRVFAITPLAPTESCALHRDMGETPYFVIDDRSLKNILVSNRLDGAVDRNPLRKLILRAPPEKMSARPSGKVVWDRKIELVGWDLPAKVERGQPFELVTYYKILADVPGNWTALMHVDGPGGRIRGGDHKPIKDRCPTGTWKAGDYIVDRHTMTTSGGSYATGSYEVWIGFFTGSSPNFRNMTVSEAPEGMRDANDRVKITKLQLQ